MVEDKAEAKASSGERIDVKHDYGLCAWARHFNVSEKRLKEAVAAVGDRADRVSEHLKVGSDSPQNGQERPLSY